MNGIITFALKQRILVVILLLLVLGGRRRRLPQPQHRGLSRSGAAAGRRRHAEHRPVGRGDRALHHHPDRDPDGRASRTSRRSARSRCSACPTSRCSSPTTSPIDQAEQWVINRLSQLGALPNGAQPQISPTSPIGEIYRYRVVGPPGYSVTDLKTLEDWVLERRFKAVPGRHRRHRLGRQDQDLRGRDRSAQADRLRPVGAAGAAGARQRQHQRRRPDRQLRRAIGRGSRRRPDPFDRRHPQHDARRTTRARRC